MILHYQRVNPKTPPIQAEAVDALIHLAREKPLQKEDISITKNELIKTARYAYEKIIALSQIEDSKDNNCCDIFYRMRSGN
ncbi:MAG: hypothetical protein CM1200mP10_02710 [Candidatus Neomarinimicrobiota bacterium]|nr:MAG: hypothetical protein CM1200mP10_02710 [Candidatus Neomarinimicrobiota bacterium]